MSVPEDVLQTLLKDYIVFCLNSEKHASQRTCLIVCEKFLPRFFCELSETPQLCILDKYFITHGRKEEQILKRLFFSSSDASSIEAFGGT